MIRYKEIKMACVSDIHLGHRSNKTIDIVRRLREAFPDNAETSELDIIFIAGDVFDSLLNLDDNPHIAEIDYWISNLLNICANRNILIRVLKGTPSHDWDQSQRFEIIKQIGNIPCNLKYVDNLEIEYISELDINVLYIPDELESTSEKTLSRVKTLIKSKGLEKVDYAIMHGQFEYQLPEFVKAQKHDSKAYLDLVNGLIFIGHVHKSSQYGRIIAQGSFDRLSHGEEDPKGHMRATRKTDGTHDIVFIENKKAKKYITISCLYLPIEDAISKIERVVAELPSDSFVRLELNKDHPLTSNMDVLVKMFPLFNWSKLIREEEEVFEELEVVEETFTAITLTSENIPNLLLNRLSTKISPELIGLGESILKECL